MRHTTQTLGIFLAAFYTLRHTNLLKRLEYSYGFSGLGLQFLNSYLTGRSQFVYYNNERTPETLLTQGVPQGSVLGPILFTSFIAPVSKLIKAHGVLHQQYADDTQLYIFVNSSNFQAQINTFQNCLNDIKTWFYIMIWPLTETTLLSTKYRV